MTSFSHSLGLTFCVLQVASHEIFYAQATGLLPFMNRQELFFSHYSFHGLFISKVTEKWMQSNGKVDGFTMCIYRMLTVCVTLWILWVTVPLSARTWNMTVIFRRRWGIGNCRRWLPQTGWVFFHINELFQVIDKNYTFLSIGILTIPLFISFSPVFLNPKDW